MPRNPKDPGSIRSIDWRKARYLTGGSYAAVFCVGPRTVAKVGKIDRTEAELQRFYARKGLALPVIAYKQNTMLPLPLRRKSCPVHGPRKQVAAIGEDCHCNDAFDVLLMPLADTDITIGEANRVMENMMQEQEDHPEQRPWDARADNCAKYRGRLVALDFGGNR